MAFALKSITAAVTSAVLLSSAASAAGLGRLTVLSGLGQPLRAEIELTTSSGEDPSSMSVKLASPDAFRSANIEFNPALMSLRFNVENRGGRQIIRVNSSQPMNEPFVDMLLELSWNNGRLVREYTFLLDPPELRATQPAQVAAQPRANGANGASAAAASRPATATRPAPAAASAGAEADADSASSYRVRRGDTLGRIAGRVKPADISLDMMLVALYRANPDAFIGNNMNRLKSGQILSVPDADAVRSGASEGEARGVVVAHAADFDAYRNKLAGQVATSTPAAAAPGSQSASGRVSAQVQERATATSEAQDKLRLSKAQAAPSGAQPAGTASVEDTVAKQKELAQAEARVKELEKNVGDLEKLATVESRAGAEAQQAAGAAAPVAETPVAADAAPAAETAPAPQPAPRIRPAQPETPAEPGLGATIVDNLHYIAGGVLALLLGGLLVARRRKKDEEPVRHLQTEPSVINVPGTGANSLFAETGGQSVDTNNSVFNSSFAPSASQLDTNEVDPVAEADVYIAYGRDQQAEEILKEALRTHPERHPVRLKLLEIYAARKDARAFETQARELHALTRGQGEDWSQAAALGLGIDPTNALYSNGPAAAPAPAPAPAAQQAALSQQFENAFRGNAPAAPGNASGGMGAGLAAGAAAGIAATSLAKSDDRTAVPQAAPSQPEPVAEDNTLDFDLGGLSFEPVTDTAPAAPLDFRPDPETTAVPDLAFNLDAAPAVAAQPASGNDLAFDMDFDAPAQPAAADDFALDLSPQAQPQAAPVDMAGLAKDFEGLPPLPGTMPQPSVPAASAADDPLFDLDTMDFGQPATPVTPAAPAATVQDDPLFDLDNMDFGQPATPAASAPQDNSFAFDLPETPAAPAAPSANGLDDFNLDLPAEQGNFVDSAQAQPVDAEGPASQLSPEHMEMETKLDLAIAYQEIGDKEGARELLDEVIKGGNGEQVSKAKSMRDLLA